MASALYFGLSAFVGVTADDTEIYITKPPEAQTPNVLFSVDTSGSMRESVPGSTQSRMEAVKEAITDLVNTTGNLKAGLARFHPFIGSPIIFPVRDINKTIDNEDPFPDSHTTFSAIDRGTDDAEQSTVTGELILDDPTLEMTEIQEFVPGLGTVDTDTKCFMPKDSNDDDEHGASGNATMDSPDLDIGDFDSGIRFFDVDLPRNAIILHAEVEFTARTSSSGSTSATIRGHAVGDSPFFVDSPTSDPDAVRPRIANAATDASFIWSNIQAVSGGDKITTPNIRSIVQEIVSHDNWMDNNPLTLLFEAQGGNRELMSVDGDSGDYDDGCEGSDVDRPKLRVTYVEQNEAAQFSRQPSESGDEIWEATGSFGEEDSDPDFLPLVTAQYEICFGFWGCFDLVRPARTGIRFPNITIPEGANVLWADIVFTSESDNPSGTRDRINIFGVDESDPAPFNESSRRPSQLGTTSAVTWEDETLRDDEEIFTPLGSNTFRTPNLADIVNDIADNTSFESGNHMAFIFEDHSSSGENEQIACSRRAALLGLGSCPEDTKAMPTLRVFYELPNTGEPQTTEQHVGLRFNNVSVPQGAQITSAVLEFVPETTSSQSSDLSIDIENNTTPDTFSTSAPIIGRSWTGNQQWTVNGWQQDQRVASADISSLVQNVTNLSGWCGGQSLAFRISGEAGLAARAFESGSPPSLRINYDTSTLLSGQGCTTTSFVASITDAEHNVFENQNGLVRNDVGELRLDNERTIGLRFKDVSIPPGAKLNSARLKLTANRDRLTDTTISIGAQNHPNPPPFTLGNTFDVTTDRALGNDSTTVSQPPWEEGQSYTLDLDDLTGNGNTLQEIVDGNVVDSNNQEWDSGNALVLVLSTNLNRRDLEQCCGSGETPPQLTIDYEINLGDVIDPPAKQLLLSTINEMQPDGNTPLTDAIYEGAAYFSGDNVHFGRTRGAGARYDDNNQTDTDIRSIVLSDHQINSDNRILNFNGLNTGYSNTRLSHPASYGATSSGDQAEIVRPSGCSANNPEDYDCRAERINNNQSVSYISPFENAEPCERGFLVLLSDGLARDNSSRQLARNLTGASSCSMNIPILDESTGEPMLPDGSNNFISRDPSTYEQCGLELSDYLYKQDFIDDGTVDTDVRNNVRTFTIGFNLDLDRNADRNAVEYLQALSFVGSGGDLDDVRADAGPQYGDGFYPASTASELREVFETILNEIIQETTSFVAPGISVNAFNRLFNLDDIYFSLFRPSGQRGWKGNLKKFKLCTERETEANPTPSCDFGEVIDARTPPRPAVNDENIDDEDFGTLKPEALGHWSESSDSAPEIDQGGAGERIPGYESRNVYLGTTSPSDSENGLALTKIDRSSHTGGTEPADDESFNVVKQVLYDNENCTSGNPTLSEANACLDELVRWLTGEKFEHDDPRSPDDDANRWAFGDPMHSRPLVLTYGQQTSDGDAVPLSKIFVGTNDGGFRMINDSGGVSETDDGVEEWIYYPHSMLDERQSDLKNNPDGDHIYGVDDSPSARINDVDDDGIIEPDDGDFVHVYFGLRRGGRHIYALDVTPSSQITGSNLMNQIQPELLWRIDGANTPGFQRLGETWSSPRPVRIALNDGPRTVLIFGGGYSSGEQDGTDSDDADKYNTPTQGDSVGNAIYIVDAQTGELLWWASGNISDEEGVVNGTHVPEMNTSIAAPVTPISTDGDPFVDQIYAVDLRGQVFRVDLAVNSGAVGDQSLLGGSSVGVLAELGGVDEDYNRRKFFYAPEVAPVVDEQIGGGSYNLVGIVSGNRPRPLGKTVLDRAYGLRDYLVDEQLDDSNYPACNPNDETDGCTGTDALNNPEPIMHDDLVDVTEQNSFINRTDDGGLEGSDSALSSLKKSHGWYFDLEGESLFTGDDIMLTGEKGFSAATVLDGKMFFTTFLPPATDASGDLVEDACSIRETLGTSRLYAVDFFTGAPAFSDFCVQEDCDADTFEKQDRVRSLGAGPSADLVPAYLPGGTILPVPTGAGAVVQDPRINRTAEKTFWIENR